MANPDQADTDSDGTGDLCDPTPNGDDDGDGIENALDNCPVNANPDQADWDTDGLGDACDPTPYGTLNIGPPDGVYLNVTCGGPQVIDLGAANRIQSRPGIDFVIYERANSGTVFVDRLILELSAGPGGPWVQMYHWGDSVADGNTSLAGHAGSGEPDNYGLPATNPPFYGIPPLATGITVDIDPIAPGTYQYVRMSVPASACPSVGDDNEVDAIEVFAPPDADGDGVTDASDNCPAAANPDQADADGDGTGNVCDPTPNGDSDGDGVDNLSDNCPAVANPDQADADGDGTGNVCDPTPNGDSDGDGVDNLSDNCPAVANPDQADADGDGTGNVCDPTPNGDSDGDGVDNLSDNCSAVANPDQSNGDGDSFGDACEITGLNLNLVSVCTADPAVTRGWRVDNPNTDPLMFTWEVVSSGETGGPQQADPGDGSNPGQVYFTTTTDPVDNTTTISVGGVQHSVSASSGDTC